MTTEQLQEAKRVLNLMNGKISVLTDCVNLALRGKISQITLSAEQVSALKTKYTDEKTALPDLYSQLP